MTEHQILTWKDQVQDEILTLSTIKRQIKHSVTEYLKFCETTQYDVSWYEQYRLLRKDIKQSSFDLEQILEVYSERFMHLAEFYDKSTKASTLVSENYEKLEECVEVARTEIREVLKKLGSLSTLEMDYYDKLLTAWIEPKETTKLFPDQTFQQDYRRYRQRLNQIHRNDQIHLFGQHVSASLSTVIHIIQKLYSILDCKKNVNEIKKLWTEQNDYQY